MTIAPLKLVVVSAGTSDPSSTRLLADRAVQSFIGLAAQRGREASAQVIELRPLAQEIATGLTAGLSGEGLRAAAEVLADADAVIAATPIYQAGASALFSGFFQVLDDDLLIATPVLLSATAGSPRHSLVIDGQIRPIFAYLRALVVPTALFAAPEDFADSGLGKRIDRAAGELIALASSQVSAEIHREGHDAYQRRFGSAASGEEIDLDTDLMRLATGGSTRA